MGAGNPRPAEPAVPIRILGQVLLVEICPTEDKGPFWGEVSKEFGEVSKAIGAAGGQVLPVARRDYRSRSGWAIQAFAPPSLSQLSSTA